MLSDFYHQVSQTVEEVVALTQSDTETCEHTVTPIEYVLAKHLVSTFALKQFLLLWTQKLVFIILEALIIILRYVFTTALLRKDRIFGVFAVFETGF